MKPYSRWDYAHDAELIRLYPAQTNQQIAELFGVPKHVVKIQAKRLGLIKPVGFLSNYQKHHNPSRDTRFGGRKGFAMTARIQPGTIVWCTSHVGRGDAPQWHIYTGSGHPQPLKRWLWEIYVGLIPRGYLIRFRDGNARRCVLSNLECISRADNARRNANPEKRLETMRAGRCVDSYYASRMYMKDRAMRDFVLKHAPDLVEAKRQQLKLRYQLRQVL